MGLMHLTGNTALGYGRKGVAEVPSILNKRRFTAKIRSPADARRSGACLLKATDPRTVDLSMNPSTSLDLRRGPIFFFLGGEVLAAPFRNFV